MQSIILCFTLNTGPGLSASTVRGLIARYGNTAAITLLNAASYQSYLENYKYRAQEFLAAAVSGHRGSPHLTNIGAEPLNRLRLHGGDGAGTLLLSSPYFHLGGGQLAQLVLPFRSETCSRHKEPANSEVKTEWGSHSGTQAMDASVEFFSTAGKFEAMAQPLGGSVALTRLIEANHRNG